MFNPRVKNEPSALDVLALLCSRKLAPRFSTNPLRNRNQLRPRFAVNCFSFWFRLGPSGSSVLTCSCLQIWFGLKYTIIGTKTTFTTGIVGISTWLPFHCFGTTQWLLWFHLKILTFSAFNLPDLDASFLLNMKGIFDWTTFDSQL